MTLPIFFMNDDARILNLMKNGDEEALVIVYKQNRAMVTSLVKRNGGSDDDAEDVLQESVIILWEKVRSGQFEQSSKLSTFIFAVAKNVWSRKRFKKQREQPTEFESDTFDSFEPSPLDDLIDTERSLRVATALEQLGDPCKTLLLLYYWEEKSQEEIAEEMGFANAKTVKSKKYTCKKMLEKILIDSGMTIDVLRS